MRGTFRSDVHDFRKGAPRGSSPNSGRRDQEGEECQCGPSPVPTTATDSPQREQTGPNEDQECESGEGGEPEAFREASWDEALAKAVEILSAHRGDDLGVLVHPSTSNEEGALLVRLADALGTGNVDHRIAQHDLSDGAVAEAFGMAVADLEVADAIVLVGTNLRHEVPLLHQRLRKAAKRGAKIHVVNPVDFDFAFAIASKTIVPPSQITSIRFHSPTGASTSFGPRTPRTSFHLGSRPHQL